MYASAPGHNPLLLLDHSASYPSNKTSPLPLVNISPPLSPLLGHFSTPRWNHLPCGFGPGVRFSGEGRWLGVSVGGPGSERSRWGPSG